MPSPSARRSRMRASAFAPRSAFAQRPVSSARLQVAPATVVPSARPVAASPPPASSASSASSACLASPAHSLARAPFVAPGGPRTGRLPLDALQQSLPADVVFLGGRRQVDGPHGTAQFGHQVEPAPRGEGTTQRSRPRVSLRSTLRRAMRPDPNGASRWGLFLAAAGAGGYLFFGRYSLCPAELMTYLPPRGPVWTTWADLSGAAAALTCLRYSQGGVAA